MSTPVRRGPAGRYGPQGPGRRLPRPLLWIGGAAVAALALVGAFVFARSTAGRTGSLDFGVRTFDLSPDSVRVTFEVRRTPERPVLCLVRARDSTGREVGMAQVPVPTDPGGHSLTTVSYTLATDGVPVSGEVPSCRYTAPG